MILFVETAGYVRHQSIAIEGKSSEIAIQTSPEAWSVGLNSVREISRLELSVLVFKVPPSGESDHVHPSYMRKNVRLCLLHLPQLS